MSGEDFHLELGDPFHVPVRKFVVLDQKLALLVTPQLLGAPFVARPLVGDLSVRRVPPSPGQDALDFAFQWFAL